MAFSAKSKEQFPSDAIRMSEDEFLIFQSKVIDGYQPSSEV